MKSILNIGRIGGITISIHWTFLLLFLWIGFVNYLAGSNSQELVWSLLLIISIFVSILAHESGHALVAKYFGIQASGVILLPIGGVASIPYLPKKPGQEILITLAGPAVNLLIALLLLQFIHPYSAYWSDAENIGTVNTGNFLFQLQVINLFLGVFNLIPAFPMDGGRILRTLLGLNMNIVKSTKIAGIISSIVACGLIVFGIISISVPLVLLGIFIFFSARAEAHYLQLKTIARGFKLKDVVMHNYDSLDADATVIEVSSILTNNHSKYFMVMENGRPVGTVNRMKIIKSIAEMEYHVKIKEMMKANLEFLNGNEDAGNFIKKLAGREERLYPVMDNGHFLGVTNFRYVMEYLLIHPDSTKEYGGIKSLAGVV